MNILIQVATLLALQVCLTQSTDLCNNDSMRFHLRNACTKLVSGYSRYSRSVDLSDYNVTIVPGHKEYSHKMAKKLTHRDMPGVYFLVYSPHVKFVHSKKHHSHAHRNEELEIVNLKSNEQLDNYEYRHVKNLNRHHSNNHKNQHKNMGASAYRYNAEAAQNSDENKFDFVGLSDENNKNYDENKFEFVGLSDQDNKNNEEYYENMASDLLTVGMAQNQRHHREVVGTDNHDNELRVRREFLPIHKCCDNPKLPACELLLCN